MRARRRGRDGASDQRGRATRGRAGAGGAAPGGLGVPERARWARSVRTTAGSCTVAMTRSRPPQLARHRRHRDRGKLRGQSGDGKSVARKLAAAMQNRPAM
ncbi:MAG: hypothetical protein A2X51_13075 [Candidatus Rokubacteria bacterium GWC2_70_24]|nr:MAG: hypothetical protein A2X51_13075 [Candidatus Rokubacteria bacterium GWC2_70_24]